MSDYLINHCDRITRKLIPGFSKFNINFQFERQLRTSLIEKYKQDKRNSDEVFDQKCNQMYYPAFQQVINFIEQVFCSQTLFKDNSRIQATSFVMGEYISDHQEILEKLVVEISNRRKSLTIQRIGFSITKKAQLQTELDKLKKPKQLLVIVDQAIDMEVSTLNSLVVRLHSFITEGTRVAILFCVTKECNTIYRQLKPEIRCNAINFHPVILNAIENFKIDPSHNIQFVDYSNLAPSTKLIKFFADDFMYKDPTITNLRYVYQYCLFRFYDYTLSMFTLQKRDILKLLKSNPEKVITLKQFNSIQSNQSGIQWKSSDKIASFCEEKINYLKTNHKSLLTQISYYYELLRDKDNFPNYPIDIYEKLVAANNLAECETFIEAIYCLKKYSREGIMRRIDKAIASDHELVTKDEKTLHDMFTTYKTKFENNQEGKEVVSKLIDALIAHAKVLTNPFHLPMAELFYFNDVKTVKSRLTSFRKVRYSVPTDKEILSLPVGREYYFRILLKLVMNSTHEISQSDLFLDFRQDVENYGKLKKESRSGSSTPKKARACPETDHEQDIGFIKALYIDLIEDMEYIGLLSQKLRQTRKGFLDRRLWHVFSEVNKIY